MLRVTQMQMQSSMVPCRRLHQSAGTGRWVAFRGHLRGWLLQWSVRGRGGREMCFIEGRGEARMSDEAKSWYRIRKKAEPSPAQIMLRKAVLSSRFLTLNLTGWAYLTCSVGQLIAHKCLLGSQGLCSALEIWSLKRWSYSCVHSSKNNL